jgi:hypothetical protein
MMEQSADKSFSARSDSRGGIMREIDMHPVGSASEAYRLFSQRKQEIHTVT